MRFGPVLRSTHSKSGAQQQSRQLIRLTNPRKVKLIGKSAAFQRCSKCLPPGCFIIRSGLLKRCLWLAPPSGWEKVSCIGGVGPPANGQRENVVTSGAITTCLGG